MARAKVLRYILNYFDDHDIEVETPSLHDVAGGAATSIPDASQHPRDGPQAADAEHLKLVVGGMERVYDGEELPQRGHLGSA